MKKKNYLTIKDFPPEIRPRERLFGCGPESLSDAELLAVVISTGREGETAIQLSQRILSEFGVLGTLGRATLEELSLIEGIGEAKAARILASLELGRRLSTPISTRRPVISTPRDAADLLMSEMRYFDKEHFKALILNTKNEVLKVVDISIGSLNSAVVHPRELFKIAIKHSGAAVIVVHNHPSGDATPSSEDIALTKRLARAGEVLGIDFLDHIVVGDGEFTSLKEREFF
ncbi:MAG: DNA repair protein RadC [Actinomycetota bacterium]|nr:DNA repair protein RadC [Actinomycetota bacterium]